MATVKPRLLVAFLCSDVIFDGNGLPFSLNEPIHTLQIPAGTNAPFRPPPMSLYAQLEDAVGTFSFAVEVRDELGFVVNPNPLRRMIAFVGTGHTLVPLEQVFDLDVSFPGPGVYFMHLLCNHQSLSETVKPGEVPFPAPRIHVIV